MHQTRIALFDDHPVLLQGLASFFNSQEDFEVVGHGSTAAEIAAVAGSKSPEILVVDLNMPGNVLEMIATLTATMCRSKIVVFTASTSVEHAVCALEAGASGYVIKGSTAPELAGALREVAAGETYIATSFATKVITALRNSAVRKKAAEAIKLSIREEQIVRLLLRGGTNKEIARQLAISEKTVKHYMSVLMQKLNARNRVEVVLAAQEMAAGSRPHIIQ
jgi:two-component system, NarL family, nitrate/nitrite response regulator NarL